MRFDARVILEKRLRSFSALTVGDRIPVAFGGVVYEVTVERAEPEDAVNVTECDVEIDFLEAEDVKKVTKIINKE
jgi:hypothetical protein